MARRLQHNIAFTIQLHRMMVDILTARRELRTQLEEQGASDADSGSEDSNGDSSDDDGSSDDPASDSESTTEAEYYEEPPD